MRPWRTSVPTWVSLVAVVAAGGAALLLGPWWRSGRSTATEATRSAVVERVAEEIAERSGRRSDEPDAAARFYAAKRQPLVPGTDPVAAYREARRRMAAMPRHALALGGAVTGGDAGMAAAPHLAGWEPLGPGNIGGRTRVLLVHPWNPAVMYACGVSGGVWKTVDGGQRWEPLADELANITVNALAFDPADPETLIAGTGEGYFRELVRGTGLPLRGAGIFASSDGGASWRQLPGADGPDFHWVNDLVVSPNDSRRIYAATRSGVWRSLDGGQSWQRVLATQVMGGCLDLAVRADRPTDTLFASCGTFEQATVYRTEVGEGDGAWEAVLAEPGMGRTSLAIAPSDPDVVYALAAFNDPLGREQFDQGVLGVFRSTAGGAPGTWETRVRYDRGSKLAALLLTNPIAASYRECGFAAANVYVTMGWYVNVVAVDPRDPDMVWAAGVDLFRSGDGGASWGAASYWWADEATSSFAHADHHGITFHPAYDGAANQTMFAVGDGGIFRTDNARAAVGSDVDDLCNPRRSRVRFTPLNRHFGVTQFYHGAPFPGGTRYLGGTQDNGTLLGDDGWGHDGWERILGGDGGYVAVDPGAPDIVYAETQWFDFYVSRNGGRTFTSAVRGIGEASSDFLFITPFILDPNVPSRLWAGGRRLWRSDDRASRWSAASTTLDDGGKVSALAVATGMSDRMVAGTDRGTIYRSSRATSASSTTVWEAASPRPGFLTSLAFDPTDPEVVWATYGGFGGAHVWHSRDGGATWAPRDGSGAAALPDIPAHCILVDPHNRQRLFLGTDLGVFVSPDGGASWLVENTGFASVVTEALAITTGSGGRPVLFAFTHGRGAFRVEIPEHDGSAQRPVRRRLPAAP